MYPELIPVKEAFKIIEKVETEPEKERITLEKANSRILAEDITVWVDVPAFDRAAMDGYAVKSGDTSRASKTEPVHLKVVDEIGAGSVYQSTLKKGQAVRIATGAPMPQGSDAVVMHEHVKLSGNMIEIVTPLNAKKDVALQGEDLKKGEIILRRDQFLGPHHVALIASSGHKTIKVFKKPEVAVITTGSELVEPSKDLKPGKSINSNKYALKGLVEDALAVPHLTSCPDNMETLLSTLEHAAENYDAIITTGGTAISRGDLVVDAVNTLGEVLIHGVSTKPGKPVGFGVINRKPVFMLSGYPVAAAVQYDSFVRRYILRMQNIHKKFQLMECTAGNDIKASEKKQNVIRATFNENEGVVYPLKTKAGINKSIVLSNCYIIVEEGVGNIKKGEKCKILNYSSLKVF